MNVKDLPYYQQLLDTIEDIDADTAILQMEEYLSGIEKGLEVLKKARKYPDRIVLENQKGFRELIIRYKKKFNRN